MCSLLAKTVVPTVVALGLSAALPVAGEGREEDPREPEKLSPGSTESQRPEDGRRWWIAPPAEFYPYYIADPRRSQSALLLVGILSSEIPDSEGPRFATRLGGRFPLLRAHPESRPDLGWQIDFEAGFFAHFDIDYSLDNIGWDGLYGLTLSWKPKPGLAFRVGRLHDSAHVGDEYAERVGRERIGYTREEYVLGTSLKTAEVWHVYGEVGYAANELDDFQEPLRIQAGVERVGRRHFLDGRMRIYWATDLAATEERDWRITVTAQLGVMMPSGLGTTRYRFALEYGHGRSALGEFFFRDCSYLALGWYFDF
jgi:hypothetical protein